jgi:predicted heme/steroid binding protein/uncharacterized membrane protein
MKKYTRKELADLDGKEGRPPHAAVDGKVYDLSGSDMWAGGQHMQQHQAGADLTAEFPKAPHGPEVLERVKEVGVLEEEALTAGAAPPDWALRLIGFHPHPISVHFPQAFFAFAPFFLLLAYYFNGRYFERTAYYLLFFGLAMSIPAILTGFFHWIYKYGKSEKPVFKFKIVMPLILFGLAAVTLFLHATKGHLPLNRVDWLVTILYLLLIPAIVSIGHAGGRIVFGGGK